MKKTRKPTRPKLRFDLEKLQDLDTACAFQAASSRKFTPLIGLKDNDMNLDTMVTTYNTAVTVAASEIFSVTGKSLRSPEILSTSVLKRR